MSTSAISIRGIGKAYKLGVERQQYPTFREAVTEALQAPLRHLRSLSESTAGSDTFWALKHVSFDVQPGEVVGIIGRNGAGKSTLLKILSQITEPTEGEARLRGRVASLLEVGTGFHPELTGRENVYLNGAILGMKRAEIARKFDEIVAFAEVEKFLDTPVKRYSSGMYVRLAFAVAAHLEPEILIVDEVLAVGDAEFQKKCLGKMQEVARGQGRTVLFVSHNLGAVRRLCASCILLSAGSLVAFDNTPDVVDRFLQCAAESSGAGAIADRWRPPGLSVVFTGFRCLPADSSTPVVSGGPVVFEIDYRAPQRIRNATVGIHIDTLAGDRVLCFNTRWALGPVSLPHASGTLRCHVPFLPLTPGAYKVDLGISSNGRQLDYLEHAASFDVQFADYFGTGEMPHANQGRIICEAQWRI